ncbi:MAG: polyphosphate polymerase domain-containing protein [Paludibacter sp.]|nr:polyphosphate polymerase domain-containing protein [Paludibacter sp.]
MDDYILQNNTSTLNNTVKNESRANDSLLDLFARFDSIPLEEMDNVKLMNRVDTKFLLNIAHLPFLMSKAVDHYRIVEIDGHRISPYSTIYFDTDDADMYIMHHNGKLNRFKIRMRSYVNSKISFLEIKRKNNKGRTSKKRVEINVDQFLSMTFSDDENHFITTKSPYLPSGLKPQLQNFFQRITLVDKNLTERVTLDTSLVYRDLANGNDKSIDGLVIVEMKQDGAYKSYFKEYLNELKILPGSMSKYCLGMVLLYPDLKKNRFKKKLRIINKITNNNHGTI